MSAQRETRTKKRNNPRPAALCAMSWMLESRLEASLGRCWAWSSKPVVRHFVSRVGSTPTSFRHKAGGTAP